MKKIILATLLCVFGLSGVYAQNWSKEMQKEFRDAKQISFEVDLSEATIMGVSRDKFATYYSGKYQKTEEYANLILEKMQNTIKDKFFKFSAKKARYDANAPYKVVYVFTSITENAGLNGYIYVIKDGNKSEEIAFSVKDGRWNDFDKLFEENAEKLVKPVYGKNADTPYSQRLYPKGK